MLCVPEASTSLPGAAPSQLPGHLIYVFSSFLTGSCLSTFPCERNHGSNSGRSKCPCPCLSFQYHGPQLLRLWLVPWEQHQAQSRACSAQEATAARSAESTGKQECFLTRSRVLSRRRHSGNPLITKGHPPPSPGAARPEPLVDWLSWQEVGIPSHFHCARTHVRAA